jgi:hypothetical protein
MSIRYCKACGCTLEYDKLEDPDCPTLWKNGKIIAHGVVCNGDVFCLYCLKRARLPGGAIDGRILYPGDYGVYY